MKSDCDDAAALALAHQLTDRGETNLIGVITSTNAPHVVGAIDAINHYYGRPDLPIGLMEGNILVGSDYFAPTLADQARFPSDLTNATAPKATALYRKLLYESDSKVVIAVIGYQESLRRLLESTAYHDGDSIPLNGLQLVQQRVEQVVIMGGDFKSPGIREWNVRQNLSAAQKIAADWPTPIIYTGREIGIEVKTGGGLSSPETNPVAMAYKLFPEAGGAGKIGERPSWDLLAVLQAVRGNRHNGQELWSLSKPGFAQFNDEYPYTRFSQNSNGNHRFHIESAPPQTVADIIDPLIEASPVSTAPATPTNWEARALDYNRVLLSWNHSSNSDQFRVERNTGDGFELVATLSPSTRNHEDNAAPASTSINYRITAFNAAGESSPVYSRTTTPAPAPEITTNTLPSSLLGEYYSVTLEASRGEGPLLWRLSSGTLPNGIQLDANSGTLSGTATENGEFPIAVTIRDELAREDTVNLTLRITLPDLPPTAPTQAAANIESNNTITVSWSHDGSADSFLLQRDSGQGFNQIAEIAPQSRSYTDTSTSPGNTYTYRILAINQAGQTTTQTQSITIDEAVEPTEGQISWTGTNNGIANRWSFINPLEDSTVTAANGKLTLNQPAGEVRDLWTNNLDGARVEQLVTDEDLELVVKLGSTPNQHIQLQGLYFAQAEGNLIRFDIQHINGNNFAWAGRLNGSSGTTYFRTKVSVTVAPYYMRIKRSGDRWSYEYSDNGVNWTLAGRFDAPLSVSKFGLWAGSSNSSFDATFDSVSLEGAQAIPQNGTVDALATTGGSVSKSPDQAFFPIGQTVTLTPTPEDGYTFSGWSGDATGNDNPLTWTVEGDANLVANFEEVETGSSGAINISANAGGSVSSSPERAVYGANEEVTLTATPEENYTFSGWSGDAAGNSNPLTWTVDGDANITANFEEISPPIDPGPGNNGLIGDSFDSGLAGDWTLVNPLGDASISVSNGELIISQPAGKSRDLWTNNMNAARIERSVQDGNIVIETKITAAPSRNVQLQGLYFKQEENDLLRFEIQHLNNNTYAWAGRLNGSAGQTKFRVNIPDATEYYLKVSRVNNQWTFEYSMDRETWSRAGSFQEDIAVSSIGLWAGSSYPAFQAKFDYIATNFATLETSSTLGGTISVDPEKSVYIEGETVQLTAIAEEGWSFDGWSGDVSGSENPLSLSIQNSINVTANFSNSPAPVGDFINDGFENGIGSQWEIVDPSGDSVATTSNGSLILSLSGGSSKDLWSNNRNALRIEQSFQDQDFEIETRIGILPTESVTLQGFYFEDANGNLLRFDLQFLNDTSYAYSGTLLENRGTTRFRVRVEPTDSYFMRVQRRGDTWTYLYSYDGVNWTEAGSYNSDLVVSKIGVFAGTSSPTFNADFDYVEIHRDAAARAFADTAPDQIASSIVAGSTSHPINLWYGESQHFGRQGVPQKWVNILGSIESTDQLQSLNYTLNGGSPSDLSIGPDTRRLANNGDFNVEIDIDDLQEGENTVTIEFKTIDGDSFNKSVTLDFASDQIWPNPYSVDWERVSNIQDAVQIVDGKWEYDAEGVRPSEIGYERILAIGDTLWEDYEITVPVTVHSVDSNGYNPVSVSPGLGIAMRWQGHSDLGDMLDGPWQPVIGSIPFGADIWYDWASGGMLYLEGENELFEEDPSARTIELGQTYLFKFRVETPSDQSEGSLYSFKMWEASNNEPTDWELFGRENGNDVPSGSLLLIVHHVDATFGDISITPIQN